MKVFSRFLVLAFALLLVGCSTFKNQDKKYLDAQSIPPLKTPPGISADAFQTYYAVPNRQYSRELEDVSLEPPGLMTQS